MDPQSVTRLLQAVAEGKLSPAEAAEQFAQHPYAEVEGATGHPEARVDHHRSMRCGFPEVVFCQGKTPDQVASVVREILERSDVVLATRATPEHFQAVARRIGDARWLETPRLIVVDRREEPPSEGLVVVASAGTADVPVAEEAAACAEVMGCRVTRLFDVGVAGVHRVLAETATLRSARVVIAVAGMEGALPSVVAGLVDVPIIAVPTSVGYGANFGGVSALLTMLNSCAGGIGVVNIDNGFGAAVLATRVNRPGWLEREAVSSAAASEVVDR
ncbi:MAG TPA: nickel pincer cofactor biosynthesis protein LarB [Coriobacteriia bacterium]|nr:nickel pincer cofactor biosynthesis protein LarB [Coriobacteriia bacterium]